MTDGRRLLYRWARCDEACVDAVTEIEDYGGLINDTRDITGVAYDGMPHGSGVSNPTERKALQVLALEEEFAAHIEFLTAKVIGDLEVKRIVECVLDEFPAQYREVATLRYKDGLSWGRISRKLFRSESGCREIDRILVDAVEKEYKDDLA